VEYNQRFLSISWGKLTFSRLGNVAKTFFIFLSVSASSKDFYQSVGESNIHGSRDAFQLAIKRGLIDSNCGSVLMESIKSRNKTIHTYNEETAEEIFQAIIYEYYQAFSTLEQALEKEEKQRKG
jgi:uncharacterized protein YutE (UPF0331/DUF86 family)